MSEVSAEAVAAPVEASPGAVEADTASPVSEEAVTASSSEEEAHEAPETAAPSFPSADDFGWDSWDGENTSLPENVQGWGDRFSKHYENHYTGKFETEQAETDRLRSIYESLSAGLEDPRNAELSDQISEWEGKYGDLEAEKLSLQSDYDSYKEALEASLKEEADNYAVWYQEQHSHIFEDAALTEKFTNLLESGWELDHAPAAMELSDEALAIANKALADGVPMRYAIDLARKSTAQPARAAPRPGARITSGATGSPVAPNQAPKDALREATTLDDMRLAVAQKAVKRR